MNVVEGVRRRPFTVAEIRRMVEAGIIAEHENFELIDGEPVAMSPRGNQHEVLKSALLEILAKHVPDDLRLAVATSLYLSERTFVEPDLCLYPKSILPEDVNGSDVLLAIKIAGTSMPYDRGLKARIYARHGVQELWVVDAVARDTWVHHRPAADGHWGNIERVPSEAALSPLALPRLTIRMADLD